MYQPLIWLLTGCGMLRDQAGGLRAAFDAEDRKRLADALINGVRRDVELGRDFLGRKMLADQAQAVELPRSKPAYTPRHVVLASGFISTPGGVSHDRRLL
jgi:hypothetical protein